MIGSYLGTLAAFVFAALVPTRLIPQLMRSDPFMMLMTVLAVALTAGLFALLTIRGARAGAVVRAGADVGAPRTLDPQGG